ncbi:winged helix-turn-helix transcriptional regulator [Antrihabitans cavernicola]|nr:winged helix-turn-helix transcriptional regulator [Spelaeibacter cavernicola]
MKRSYNDGCGAAQALDLVGERWALLVVRELLLGPKRFTDLRSGLPGISPNVLSQRLDELEQSSIVRKRKLPPPVSAQVYDLTDWGRQLEIVLQDLGRWAAQSPTFDREACLGIDSLVMSFRTMFTPSAAVGVHASYELRVGDDVFHAEIDDGTFEIHRGSAAKPDAIIDTSPNVFAEIVYDPTGDLAAAVRDGTVVITGDPAAVERFTGYFTLPAPAAG